MKKLFTICFVIVAGLSGQAQTEGEKIVELQNSIAAILKNASNVYMDNGAYQRVTGFNFHDNDCLLTIYTFDLPIHPGTSERDGKVGSQKITIDFSKIKVVYGPKKNNFGYNAIFLSCLLGGEGVKAIETAYTYPDQYGNHYQNSYGNIEKVGLIGIPVDSTELVALFKEYKSLCKAN